jgi:hypothetical protein
MTIRLCAQIVDGEPAHIFDPGAHFSLNILRAPSNLARLTVARPPPPEFVYHLALSCHILSRYLALSCATLHCPLDLTALLFF